MTRILAALAGLLFATAAVAQTPAVPLGPGSGSGGSGGGGSSYTAAANGGLALTGTAFSLGDGVGISYASPGQLSLLGASSKLSIANTGTAAAPGYSIGGVATGGYAVSTTGYCFADVNGTCQADYGISNASGVTIPQSLYIGKSGSTVAFSLINLSGQYIIQGYGGSPNQLSIGSGTTIGFNPNGSIAGSNDAAISRISAGLIGVGTGVAGSVAGGIEAANFLGVSNVVAFGPASSNAPPAQTFNVPNVVAGTPNTAGANWTLVGSLSTGSGASGDIIFQTGGTGAGTNVQNAAVAGLTIKGATQRIIGATTVGTAGYAVASLPTTGFAVGDRAYVTDQLTACVAAGVTLTGGGSVKCPVFYNGSAWVGD